MRFRPWISWVVVGAVVLLCSSAPAVSGVHLWRITEIFSNATGTIQFIEMTTCCGSAGGEIFLSGQRLSSNSQAFTFPGNLDMTTANKHVLLATAGYAALPGAPVPDYTIPANFFSTTSDTLAFSVYDTLIFPAGALPTDGSMSLNKNEEDTTDTTFRAVNSPTNLHEKTGTISAVSGPPAVPDGTGGTRPVTVATLAPDGSSLQVSFDAATCANGADHHILFGQRSGFPAAPSGTFTLLGSVCNIGNATPYTWSGTPRATDGSNLIWFVVVTSDTTGVEGSWGVSRSGQGVEAERNGPGTNGASGTCALDKNVANGCGHTSL
jgi:hypothetical protein